MMTEEFRCINPGDFLVYLGNEIRVWLKSEVWN